MDAPLPPTSGSDHRPARLTSTDEGAWVALRDELVQLNVQLEYLKLLLKLGVHRL